MRLFLVGICSILLCCAGAQKKEKTKRPNPCAGMKVNLELGYKPHPTDCNMYMVCYKLPNGNFKSVFRKCEYGKFWDHEQLRCLPSQDVFCETDPCLDPGVKFYKHTDPNNCCAYWKCVDGASYADCCDKGQSFDEKLGCVNDTKCNDMCPYVDRMPGCDKRPVPGLPMKYQQYTKNGRWMDKSCKGGSAFSYADCACTLQDVIVPGRKCEPELRLTFDQGLVDVSGRGTKVTAHNVRTYGGAAYFSGLSSLQVAPFLPRSGGGKSELVIKMRYYDDKRRGKARKFQAMVTNGHCRVGGSSIFVGKNKKMVVMGVYANNTVSSMRLPVVPRKRWKEIILIHDEEKLEGKVCGATGNRWAVGPLLDTGCGLQFGNVRGLRGFVGLIDDIAIYRCKPMDGVININY